MARPCRGALARIRAGIALLDATPARPRPSLRQSRHAPPARPLDLRTGGQAGPAADLDGIDVPANRTWRPFQLAFILLNLPGPGRPDAPRAQRTAPRPAADLLWFPTGGGKTEAYLGLAAYTLAMRRLQGEVGRPLRRGRRGGADALHAAPADAAAVPARRGAHLRLRDASAGRMPGDLWGSEPFRIGLWVGQRSTPNWTEDAAEAIKQDRDNRVPRAAAARPTSSPTVPGAAARSSRAATSVSRPYETGPRPHLQLLRRSAGRVPVQRAPVAGRRPARSWWWTRRSTAACPRC